jgi:biotin carboxyl carrier protein
MSALADLRGLLGIVERSDWREFYLRFGEWSVFMARDGGGANPMLLAGEEAEVEGEAIPVAHHALLAPHVATFRSARPIGSQVAAGELVAEIELLGETIELRCEEGGRVTRILAAAGDLIEHGQSLVELIA